MRLCHWIKHNKISETPQRAAWISLALRTVYDSTTVATHLLVSGVIITGALNTENLAWYTTKYTFATSDELWTILDKVTKKKSRTYLVVQDSSRLLQVLDMFRQAIHYGWKCTQAVIECPPCIVRWRKESKTILLFDMQNIWPTPSVASSTTSSIWDDCAMSEEEKLSLERSRIEHDAQDMAELTTSWWKFLRTNDLGGFSPTIGAQSFRTWRHKFMTHKVLIDCHDDALALARKGMYGGRTECMYIGSAEGKFFQFDINSSYPAIMRDMSVPVRLRGYTEHATVEDLAGWVTDSVVCADIEIETDTPLYPVRNNGRLLFPCGRFRTVLVSPEINSALSRKSIRRVFSASVYDVGPAFKAYMESLWVNRLVSKSAGNVAESDKWKLLMNSFFGKWVQRGGRWENCGEAENEDTRFWTSVDYDTRVISEYRQFGGLIQTRDREKEAAESSPVIGASVTAGARLKLWQYIQAAGYENTYYVDTDSLLVNALGYSRLHSFVADDILGALKLVGTYNSISIYGPKHYRVDSILRHAGVSTAAVYVNASTIEQSENQSISASIRYGQENQALSYKTRKQIKATYDRGIVLDSGRVQPLQLNLC